MGGVSTYLSVAVAGPGPLRRREISWPRSRYVFISLQEDLMDNTAKRIINEIQSDFPLSTRPYKDLADRLGLTETEVMDTVGKLKDAGVIRRIGGNFHSSKLDFVSTLCAARVPDEKIELFVETVNGYSGVTHNYLRTHSYNIWFTFIAESMARIDENLQNISEKTGVLDILNLPAEKMFKIKVDFEL